MHADEKIILAIANLDVPLIMGSRLKKLIKAIQEAAKSYWLEVRRSGGDDNVLLPSEELKRLEVQSAHPCGRKRRRDSGEPLGTPA